MRPFHRFIVLSAALAMASTVLAQTASHPLSVAIPAYVGIRIVGASVQPTRSVVFDYANDGTAYLAAVDAGDPLPPTDVTRFDDVQVNVAGNGRWSVYVEATPFTYVGPGVGDGLTLDDVTVTPGSVSGLTQTAFFRPASRYETSWTLSATPFRIGRSVLGTGGWRSLGFNGWDYTVAVDGDEDAGAYTATVTYFLTFP